MRIALLTDGIYPYVLGGMQKHSYYLAKYLARNGVYVDLYHTGNKEAATPPLKEFSEEELAFIRPVYVPFPSVSKLPGHYMLESYLYSKSLYHIFKSNNPVDLIYAQGLTGWFFIREKRQGKSIIPPLLTNLHGLNMYQYQASVKVRMESLILKCATNFILKKSDYVVSLGGHLTTILNNLIVDNKRIIEQPIAIEKSWLENRSTSGAGIRKFVFIGRYDKVKGIDILNEVLSNLSIYQYEFHFIGPFSADVQLKRDNIIYHGLIKEENEIKGILHTCDVLVCPSYSEGMPTVVLEAMASGLAVIATDVGAVSALVSTETGWLIPAADKEALSQAIVEAINLDEKELNMKKIASLQLVKDSYTWEAVIQTTIEQIKTIVTRARA